jgi:hypothetical protein
MIKWLLNHLWKRDKLYHLVAGTLAYLLGAYYFSPAIGLLSAISAGIAKEVWDEFFRKKEVDGESVRTEDGDPWDFFATILIPLILFLISTI